MLYAIHCVYVFITVFSHASDTPTLSHLYHFTGQSGKELRIIQQVSHKWRSVAFVMGFDPTVVDTIQQSEFFQPTQSCEKMFQQWLTAATGYPQTSRTWETLIVNLRHADLSVLADDLDSELL